MDDLKSFPALESLVDLADRDDIDINPTLLRVLTDLYVTKATHTADEERQYSELALRLFEKVGVAVRHAVATKLAQYPMAPLPVVRRLARDVFAVAEPILRYSRRLDSAELAAIARELSGGHAALIADREGRTQHVRPEHSGKPSGPITGTDAVKSEFNDLFFAANATERRIIILNLHYAPPQSMAPLAGELRTAVARRLEMLALAHNTEGFAREITRAFALPLVQTRRIANDSSGEPIVIVAKVLTMPRDVLQRILLCLNPAISQSVQRVYDLIDLYDEMQFDASLQMLAIWQNSDVQPQATGHQPHHYDDENRRRQEGVRSNARSVATTQRRLVERRLLNGVLSDPRASSKRIWR